MRNLDYGIAVDGVKTYENINYYKKIKNMSTDFSFYTKIKLSEIEGKTNIKVIKEKDSIYLQDKYNNILVVNEGVFLDEITGEPDNDTFELTRYGSNDPSHILKELIEKFSLKFLIDDDEQYLYHNQVENLDEYVDKCMSRYTQNNYLDC